MSDPVLTALIIRHAEAKVGEAFGGGVRPVNAAWADIDARVADLIAAGIARERGRAVRVCRNEAQNWSTKDAQRACGMCANAIEAPANGGQPGESK